MLLPHVNADESGDECVSVKCMSEEERKRDEMSWVLGGVD